MADVKITALPAAAAVTADDLYAIVNDPGGTPETQKATHTQALTFFQAQIVATANTFTAAQAVAIDDAVTNAVTVLQTFKHTSSGTPAASFGLELLFQLETTTTPNQDAAAMDIIWTTATHGAQTSAILFKTASAGAALAETLRIAPLQLTVVGGISPSTNNSRDLGSSGIRWKDIYWGGELIGRKTTIAATVTSDIVSIIRGLAGQTANLTEWQSSTSAIYGTITENGYFTTRKIAAPADAELAASELAFWFDSTNGAGKLMIKAKTVDGTVVTGNVALT